MEADPAAGGRLNVIQPGQAVPGIQKLVKAQTPDGEQRELRGILRVAHRVLESLHRGAGQRRNIVVRYFYHRVCFRSGILHRRFRLLVKGSLRLLGLWNRRGILCLHRFFRGAGRRWLNRLLLPASGEQNQQHTKAQQQRQHTICLFHTQSFLQFVDRTSQAG